MPTVRGDTVASLNASNPFHGNIYAAINTVEGTCNELVSGTEILATSALTVNADTSISPSLDGNNYIDLVAFPSAQIFNEDYVVFIDIEVGLEANNNTDYIFEINGRTGQASRYYLSALTDRYSSGGLTITSSDDWNLPRGTYDLPNNSNYTGRHQYVIYYDSTSKILSIYRDGDLTPIYTYDSSAVPNTARSIERLRVGVGDAEDKFFASVFIAKSSFTGAEVDSIVSDPYQVFELSGSGTSQVFSDLSANWNTLNQVNKNLDLRWNLLNRVQNELDLQWSIRTAITKNLTSSWNTLNQVANDIGLNWSILVQVNRSLTLNWDILSQLAVQKDLTLSWDIKQQIINDLGVSWNTLERVTGSVELAWNTLQSIAKTLSVHYDINQLVNADIRIDWDTAQTTQNDIQINWQIESDISYPTPAFRTFIIPSENRIYTVPMENRVYRIPFENRTFYVRS